MGLNTKLLKTLFKALPSSCVWMFHHVTDCPAEQKSGCVLSTEQFEKLFGGKKAGDFASLYGVVRGKRKKIAVTFDDGLADTYTIAYPFLKVKGIPFTVFVVTDFLDTPGYITTEQLKEMSKDPLVTIGSHGVSHKILNKMSAQEQLHELSSSKKTLEEILLTTVDLFAYSHGQYNKDTLILLKKCGYSYAVTTSAKPLNILTNKRFQIPRFNIDNKKFTNS